MLSKESLLKKSDKLDDCFKNYCQKSKKSAWLNGLSGNDYRVAALSNCYRNPHAKFEIYRKILSFLN